MKIRNVVLASLMCAASALAVAQGTAGGATGQPAPDGGDNNPAAVAQGSSGSVAPTKHTSKHSTKTKKPMSDSTSGADASSATKAQ